MDTDDTPPVKVRRKGEPIWTHPEVRDQHQAVLTSYDVSVELESAGVLDGISSELLLAMDHFAPTVVELHRKTRRLLGLQPDAQSQRQGCTRLSRLLTGLKAKNKQIRRGSDESFDFLKTEVVDRYFFETDQKSNGNRCLSTPNTVSTDSVGASDESVRLFPPVICCEKEIQTEESGNSYSKSDTCSNNECTVRYDQLLEKYCRLQKTAKALKNWKSYHRALLAQPRNPKKLLRTSQISLKTLTTRFDAQHMAFSKAKRQLREQNDHISYLESVLEKSSSKLIDLKDGGSYSNSTALAVITLKDLGVADSKIGKVMQAVGELVGVSFKETPSEATCRNFALRALFLGKSHIHSVLKGFLDSGEALCLASDETTKGSTKLQAFGVHGPGGSFTCLGIEQVAEKSAQTAFATLISSVNTLPEAPTDFFKQFVVSVQSTMSDSAATELKFNKLLETYRREVIPEVVENYDKMTESERVEIGNFSQFFCQLHVDSNFTKVVLKSLLEHELAVRNLNQLEEPRVFTLVKLVCQLFGQRGAGMHQILPIWTAWCKKNKVNRFVFQSFLGHRFNIVFFCASRVFFHRHDLTKFCEEYDQAKPDLKKVRELLSCPMILDHLQVLGFCDQLIAGPLWRLAENSEHILDTCRYALQLHQWLEECKKFPGSFFDGVSPVPNLQASSPTTSALLLRELVSTVPSSNALQAAALVCPASLDYFDKQFADFLPGGKHCESADEIRASTRAAPATNRNVESVFGLISHFFDTKPNMRLDVRVAFTLISKNHTIDWFKSLPDDEQDRILTQSRAAMGQLKRDSDSRQAEIEKVILQNIRGKNQAAAKKQAKQVNDRRSCTENVIKFGFWKSEDDIEKRLKDLKTAKLRKDALTAQILFRKRILEQPAPTPKFFVLSSNGRPLTEAQLTQKLLVLLDFEANGGQLLLQADHPLVGKRFVQNPPPQPPSTSSVKGFVEDVRYFRDGPLFVTLRFDDDDGVEDENEDATQRMTVEEFENSVLAGKFILET